MLNQVVHTVTTTLYRVKFRIDYLLTLRFSGKRPRVGWRNLFTLHSEEREREREEASFFELSIYFNFGPGSSVGIATDYGLDGPGLNPGGNEIFRQSRPALGPTKPPVKWVPGRAADHSPPSSAAVMEE